MQTNITFLDRLREEQVSLSEKLSKLCHFIETNKFDEISTNQQRLLILQRHAMVVYEAILLQRIQDLNDN